MMISKKVEVFILTFICYTSIHSLRTAYSFSKHYLQESLNVEKSAIGYIDSMLLMSLGLGHFIHAISPVKLPVKTLWIGTLLCAIDYALIPLLQQTMHFNSFWVLLFLMTINGYLQSYTWPNLLMIIQRYYDPKKSSVALGFWVTNSNVGNIVGYFFCHQFVHNLGYHWEIGMYLSAGFVFLNALLIYWRIDEIHPLDHGKSKKTSQQQVAFQKQVNNHLSISQVFKDPIVVLITLGFSLIKSVIYGILLWLPIFFHNIGLKQYETWIPACYDIACVFGSLALGWVFNKTTLKGPILAPLMLILVILFTVLRYFELSVIGYFVVISGVGACLGGSFNTMAGLVTMQLAKVVPIEFQSQCLGFFSALTMSVANVTTAITQIFIGYVAKKEQSMIFAVFMVYAFLALICFIVVSVKQTLNVWKKEKQSHQSAFGKWFKDQTIREILEKSKKLKQKYKAKIQ